MRNLQKVRTLSVGQLNTYDVLWADTIVFTDATLGMVGGRTSYDPSETDFVREDEGGDEA
jgi:ribosomal protein L4